MKGVVEFSYSKTLIISRRPRIPIAFTERIIVTKTQV